MRERGRERKRDLTERYTFEREREREKKNRERGREQKRDIEREYDYVILFNLIFAQKLDQGQQNTTAAFSCPNTKCICVKKIEGSNFK